MTSFVGFLLLGMLIGWVLCWFYVASKKVDRTLYDALQEEFAGAEKRRIIAELSFSATMETKKDLEAKVQHLSKKLEEQIYAAAFSAAKYDELQLAFEELKSLTESLKTPAATKTAY